MRQIVFEDGALDNEGVILNVQVLGADDRGGKRPPKLLVIELSGDDLGDAEVRLDWIGVGVLEAAIERWKALEPPGYLGS